jgi:phenylacetate-CoA ligase
MNPAIVEHVLAPSLEALRGRDTFRVLRSLRRSERWELSRLRALQLEKLRIRVGQALRIPAWAEHAALPPEWRPDGLEDLRRLPLTDRAFLTRYGHEIADRRVPGGVVRSCTGGSTGRPLRFLLDRRRQAFDRAARMRADGWSGVGPGDRAAYVSGPPPESRREGRIRRSTDRAWNDLHLPAVDLREEVVPGWFRRLARFRPACLIGYPSTLSLFSRMLLRRGLRLTGIGIRAVVCTGEVLLSDQRAAIAECTGARVANRYACREAGLVAQECPDGRLHVAAEGLIVEVLDEREDPVVEGPGEIVVTHLESRATPFLRYRTGDIGERSSVACRCGRTLPVLAEIRGRTTDFVVTPDGRWLHGLSLIQAVRETAGVDRYRIDQEDVDELRVRIVPGTGFPDSAPKEIARRVREQTGADVRVRVDVVAEIPPDPSGKHRIVASEVAREREFRL